MKKAIILLNKILQCLTSYDDIDEVNEAIKELEDMEKQSCTGCIFERKKGFARHTECYECSRTYFDKYKK